MKRIAFIEREEDGVTVVYPVPVNDCILSFDNISDINTVVYVVLGLGCSSFGAQALENWKTSIQDSTKFKDVRVICDPSLVNTTGRVIRTCATGKRPFERLIYDVGNEIAFELAHGKRVLMAGFSYGGSVVNHMLEYLNDFMKSVCNKQQLLALTFGSIYVAMDGGINESTLYNFMYEDDVAKRCLFTDVAKTQKTFVQLPNPSIDDAERLPFVGDESYQRRKKRSLLGTKEEWEIHNSYYNFMIKILKGNSVDINGNQTTLVKREKSSSGLPENVRKLLVSKTNLAS